MLPTQFISTINSYFPLQTANYNYLLVSFAILINIFVVLSIAIKHIYQKQDGF